MTQFNIDVVVNTRPVERGMDRVDRRLQQTSNKSKGLINTAATQRALRTIQREISDVGNTLTSVFDTKFLRGLLGFTGLGIVVREVLQLGDAFTDAQNRLRLLVDGQEELTDKTRRLFEIARQTRSSFDGTAELYQRVGLAAKSLGQDSANLERVVTNVNRAIILSGASAKEANNGLIQLAQGIAANRLSGDELRSVLEQLPKVADVIAKSMTETNRALGKTGKDAVVTRGQLRDLGAQGKITGEVVLKAFDNLATSDKLAAEFAKTVPTLSQAFTVLRNATIDTFASLNEGLPIMTGLAQATLIFADSLKVLAGAFVVAAPVAALAAFNAFRAAVKSASYEQTVAAGVAKLLAAEEAKEASAAVAAASAKVNQARATLAQARAGSAYLGVVASETAATQALTAATLELEAAQVLHESALGRGADAVARANKPLTLFGKAAGFARNALVILRNTLVSPAGIVAAIIGTITGLRSFKDELGSSETVIGRLSIFANRGFDRIRSGMQAVVDSGFGQAIVAVIENISRVAEELFSARTFDRIAEAAIAAQVAVSEAFKSQAEIDFDNKTARETADLLYATGQISREAADGVETLVDLEIAQYRASVQLAQATAQEAAETKKLNEAKAALSESISSVVGKQEDQLRYLQDQIRGGKQYADILKAQLTAQRAAEEAGNTLDASSRAQVGTNQEMIAALTTVNEVLRSAETETQKLSDKMDLVSLAFQEGRINLETFDAAMAILTQSMNKANQKVAETADTFGDLRMGLVDSINEMQNAIRTGESYAAAQILIRDANRELKDKGLAPLTTEQKEQIRTLTEAEAGLKAYKDAVDASVSPLTAYERQQVSVKAALDANIITLDEYNHFLTLTQANFATLDATPMTFDERVAEGVENSMSSIEEITIAALNRTADAGAQIVTNTLNLMGEMARTGEDKWREAFNGMLGILRNTVNQMIADLIRLQIQQAIVGMLGGGTMNAFNPATSSAVPNASFGGGLIPISGTRAHGGTVHGSSKPYLVGEEGPELFFPGRTGTVMPSPETMRAISGAPAPAAPAAAPNVNVAAPQVNLTNVLDSQEIVSRGLSDDMIVEAIERNSARIQSTLN